MCVTRGMAQISKTGGVARRLPLGLRGVGRGLAGLRRDSVQENLKGRGTMLADGGVAGADFHEVVLAAPIAPKMGQARHRSLRFEHEGLLRQLRAAAISGQLDPVEWRRCRGELSDAAPHLSPEDLAVVLQGIAILRCPEPQYLTPVLLPLERLALYMSGGQLISVLQALVAFGAGELDGLGIGADLVCTRSLVEMTRARLDGRSVGELVAFLDAARQLHCLSPSILQAVVERMPLLSGFTMPELVDVLGVFRLVADDLTQRSDFCRESERALRSIMLSAQGAARQMVRTASQAQMLRLFLHCVAFDNAIISLSLVAPLPPAAENLGGATSHDGVPRADAEASGEMMAFIATAKQGIITDSDGFHRFLLGALKHPGEALQTLHASGCAELCFVLAELARRDRWHRGGRLPAPAAPAPYIARLCPLLVDRILDVLESCRAEELLAITASFSQGLGYRDDYFFSRVGEALANRLFPLRSNASGLGKANLEQVLRALSLQRPVTFADLLCAAMQDSHAWKFGVAAEWLGVASGVEATQDLPVRMASDSAPSEPQGGFAKAMHSADDTLLRPDLEWFYGVVRIFQEAAQEQQQEEGRQPQQHHHAAWPELRCAEWALPIDTLCAAQERVRQRFNLEDAVVLKFF